jgi:hypothetical protein
LQTSFGKAAAEFRKRAEKSYQEFLRHPASVATLDDLAAQIDLYVNFLYLYTFIDSPHIDSDDEVINWTAPDVAADLSNALWNLACGYHKACASSLRNAYEMTAVALTFQIEENINPRTGAYNELFSEWDRGQSDTPNWSRLISHLRTQGKFSAFSAASGSDVKSLFHGHYKSLCAYTHSRPMDAITELATNSMNLGVETPSYDGALVERFASLARQTMSLGAAMWLLAYPEMLTHNTWGSFAAEFDTLFVPSFGREAFTWVTGLP